MRFWRRLPKHWRDKVVETWIIEPDGFDHDFL